MKQITLLLLLLPFFSYAQGYTSRGGSSGGAGGMKFRLSGGFKFQRATMSSKDKFVEKRSLNGIGADATAGVSYGPLLLGVGGGYTQFYQSTDKKDVSGTDTTGSMTTVQGVAGLGAGRFVLLGRYFVSANYKLKQKTAAGETETFSKPKGSFGASLVYRPGGRSFWSLDYTNLNFSELQIGSTKTKLSDSKSQINLNSFGLTYGFMF